MMPVPAQNSCMREYVAKRGGYFLLPQVELKFENCYIQLCGTLLGASKGDTVLMYSFEMFYEAIPKISGEVNSAIAKGISFAFVLENYEIRTIDEFKQKVWTRKLRDLTCSDDRVLSYVRDFLGE